MKDGKSILIAAALVALMAGCSRGSGRDQQLTALVQSRLAADPALQGDRITATVHDGAVTLAGAVHTENERMAADEDAQAPGVARVDNRLTVNAALAASDAPPAAPNAPVDATPAAAAAQDGPSPAPPPVPEWLQISSGTPLSVRLEQSLSSDTSQPGESFRGRLTAPIEVNGEVAIPRGTQVAGTVMAADAAGHFEGRSRLVLRLTALTFDGQSYDLNTHLVTRETAPQGKKAGETVGGAAGFGAIVGAIAGHGKGAAIGALGGAAAGTAIDGLSQPAEVSLPAESVLEFRLSSPLRVAPPAQP